MSVAFKGLPTLVQLLVDAGASIVMQEVQRFTHIDCSDGLTPVDELIQDGWTALEWATRTHPTATALALMEARGEVGHITMVTRVLLPLFITLFSTRVCQNVIERR
jgi:hypothetical protein